MLLCFACASDSTPPELLVSPFDDDGLWLHDRLWFEFSEAIDYSSWTEHARMRLADGSPVQVSHGYVYDRLDLVFIQVERSVVTGGPLFVELDGIVDQSGNRLEPTILEWTLGEWTRDDVGLAVSGTVGPPTLAVMDTPGNEPSTPVVAVWTVGAEEDRRVTGVYRLTGWQTMGEDDAGDEVEVDAAASESTLHVTAGGRGWRWSWGWSPSVDYGYGARLASSPRRLQAASASAGLVGVEVALHSFGDPQPGAVASIPSARQARTLDVSLPREDSPIVAIVDRVGDFHELNVRAYVDRVWQDWGSLSIGEPYRSPSLVADGDDAYVAWAEPSDTSSSYPTHFAHASPAGIEELASPAENAASPIQLEIDPDGAVIAVWAEPDDTAFVGRIARWDGDAWQELAEPWGADERTIADPTLALWEGRVPAVAWRQGDKIRIALYNGPVTP